MDSAALLLLVFSGLARAASNLEPAIILFIVLYIDALNVDHAARVCF